MPGWTSAASCSSNRRCFERALGLATGSALTLGAVSATEGDLRDRFESGYRRLAQRVPIRTRCRAGRPGQRDPSLDACCEPRASGLAVRGPASSGAGDLAARERWHRPRRSRREDDSAAAAPCRNAAVRCARRAVLRELRRGRHPQVAAPGRPCHVRLTVAPAAGGGRRACLQCGGSIDDDGFCRDLRARGRPGAGPLADARPRGSAAVCDRGVRHARNEDAMAVWATTPRPARVAVLVVCDGVTTAPHSDRGQPGRRRGRRPTMVGGPDRGTGARSVAGARSNPGRRAGRGCRVAQVAVLGVTPPTWATPPTGRRARSRPPSSHDGRHRWPVGVAIPGCTGCPQGYARQVSTDHSAARIGDDRGQARPATMPNPTHRNHTDHAVAGGRDSRDAVADTGPYSADDSGWVVVCSDGLWNYASEPTTIAAVVREAADKGGTHAGTEPWISPPSAYRRRTRSSTRPGSVSTGSLKTAVSAVPVYST